MALGDVPRIFLLERDGNKDVLSEASAFSVVQKDNVRTLVPSEESGFFILLLIARLGGVMGWDDARGLLRWSFNRVLCLQPLLDLCNT